MLLLAHVCAEFRDRNGNTIFRVTGNDLNHTFLQAPDAIQEDPLFAMLVQDGSIVFPPKDEQEKKRLENEPLLGVDATGKTEKIVADIEKSAVKAKTEKKPAADAGAETKPVTKDAAAQTKKI